MAGTRGTSKRAAAKAAQPGITRADVTGGPAAAQAAATAAAQQSTESNRGKTSGSPDPAKTELGKAVAKAQAQGYAGTDAADGAKGKQGDGIEGAFHTDTSGPAYGGVGIPGTPGGHPDDPTVGSIVGGGKARSK